MTKEEKQLLLKDLCARLPYYVKVAIDFKSYLDLLPDDDIDSEYPYKKNLNTILLCSNKSIDDISQEPHILYSYICTERFGMLRGYDNEAYGVPVELIKPYLRPMSSMTKDENSELWFLLSEGRTNIELNSNGQLTTRDVIELGFNYPCVCPQISSQYVDWLNAHHFDYRGLIEKGIALEAPEGMYKIKESKKTEQEEDTELTDFESALFSAFSDAWQEYLSGKEVNVAKWTREHSAELLEVAREPKSAWSEDDEEILKSAISLAYDVGDINMYNWLQSLKERYTWKPSNEQIEALLKLEEMHVLEHEKNQKMPICIWLLKVLGNSY